MTNQPEDIRPFLDEDWVAGIQVALLEQAIECDTDNEGKPWPWLQTIEPLEQESIDGYQPCCGTPRLYRHTPEPEALPESPIEEAFWREWNTGPQRDFPLVPQYRIGSYRVDFAHVISRTAIELDGHATHSSPGAIAYDRKRQREIEHLGWHVLRFGGQEIYRDVAACVLEAWDLLAQRAE